MSDPDTQCNAMLAEWLAGLFSAPLSESAVAFYRHGPGRMLLDSLAEEPTAGWGIARMRAAVTVEASAAMAARILSASYTRLFSGIGRGNSISLYESAHVSASGRLFQQPVSDMSRLLGVANQSIAPAAREPPDHLSIELTLLAEFTRGNIAPASLSMLLDDHLFVWIPRFAKACCDADPDGFYAGAATVLAWFIDSQRCKLTDNTSFYAQSAGAARC